VSAATTTNSPVFVLTEDDYRDAERAWRRGGNAELSAGDFAQEIDSWLQERALLMGDLEAGDFTWHDEATLRAGIAYAEHRLAELVGPAERHARALLQPGYRTPAPRRDLTPRFEAAKSVDLVPLAETLTGQAATSTGNGRHRMRCPFHAGDRDPSLVIYPPGRGWHCFGCNRGGDAVAFVAELQKCTAVEALALVEELAHVRAA
jgi:CHC2 zinc finger